MGPPPPRRPGSGVPPANVRGYVPNEVLVELASSTSMRTIDDLGERHRLDRLEVLNLQVTGTTMLRLRIRDRRTVPAVVRALEAEQGIMAVQPHYYVQLQESAPPTAGPREVDQYALEKLRVPQAHQLATGGQIRIAVIDSGVDTQHPELAGISLETFNATGPGDLSHGTAVVGAIVAQAKLRGTAPAAHILAVRAFGGMRGVSLDVIKGLDWAIVQRAHIINMSFAGDRDPGIMRHLAIARDKGIVLIAAVGNDGQRSPPRFPAADPIVIAVTATDENDRLFGNAVVGQHVAVAAPGVSILLPAPKGQLAFRTGTSYAAPLVSGIAALLLQRNPGLDPDAVRAALVATARDLGPPGRDQQFGAGLVDAYEALLSIAPVAGSPAATVLPAAVTE